MSLAAVSRKNKRNRRVYTFGSSGAFSESRSTWSPMVRLPRLGGNKRMEFCHKVAVCPNRWDYPV